VKKFVETATVRHGLGFSPKKVTLSTCGLAPLIERLADDDVEVSLASRSTRPPMISATGSCR